MERISGTVLPFKVSFLVWDPAFLRPPSKGVLERGLRKRSYTKKGVLKGVLEGGHIKWTGPSCSLGQDVWLGKGEEQTRQILKCMWCGQSFRSLADLTTHMSETKHYTKVIPQEQLSTWRAQQQQQQQQSQQLRGSDSPSNCSTPSPLPNQQHSPVSRVIM